MPILIFRHAFSPLSTPLLRVYAAVVSFHDVFICRHADVSLITDCRDGHAMPAMADYAFAIVFAIDAMMPIFSLR